MIIDVNSFLFKGSPCECESHHFLRREWNSAPASSSAQLTFYLGLEIRSKENGWLFLIQNVNWLAASDRVNLKKRQILRCLLLSKFLNQRGLSKTWRVDQRLMASLMGNMRIKHWIIFRQAQCFLATAMSNADAHRSLRWVPRLPWDHPEKLILGWIQGSTCWGPRASKDVALISTTFLPAVPCVISPFLLVLRIPSCWLHFVA